MLILKVADLYANQFLNDVLMFCVWSLLQTAWPDHTAVYSIVNEKMKFICIKCGKKLTSKSGFDRHMQLHTGHFSYYCDRCRRGFNGNTEYERDMRSHAGLKYHCELSIHGQADVKISSFSSYW